MAAATPFGRSALAVVRLSGQELGPILREVCRPWSADRLAPSGRPRVVFRDAQGAFDDGVLIWRRGPHTATGEDLAEFTVHGNPLIVERLVEAFVQAGARLAQPGEFTRRAVVHGRLDLVEAEAVDQVIRATSPGGLALGRAGLTGALSTQIAQFREGLVAAAAELEARLDYPADELALEADDALVDRLAAVAAAAETLAASHRGGQALVEGARVALVGDVNAGKSSLFNRLAGTPRALVHDSPGTTRDVVETVARIGPLQVTLLDTAGERVTTDPVEAAGLALARQLVEDTDALVVVLRAQPGLPTPTEQAILTRTRDRRRVIVVNGIDRAEAEDALQAWTSRPEEPIVATSALTGQGIDALVSAVVRCLGVYGSAEVAVASVRQRDALRSLAAAAREAIDTLPVAGGGRRRRCGGSRTGSDRRADGCRHPRGRVGRGFRSVLHRQIAALRRGSVLTNGEQHTS